MLVTGCYVTYTTLKLMATVHKSGNYLLGKRQFNTLSRLVNLKGYAFKRCNMCISTKLCFICYRAILLTSKIRLNNYAYYNPSLLNKIHLNYISVYNTFSSLQVDRVYNLIPTRFGKLSGLCRGLEVEICVVFSQQGHQCFIFEYKLM